MVVVFCRALPPVELKRVSECQPGSRSKSDIYFLPVRERAPSDRNDARHGIRVTMLQHLLVAMPAQADGVESEKGAAICGTSDLPATDTPVLQCGFIAAAKLLFEFEVRKGF